MRFAICNETFVGWDHLRICQTVAELGYEGLELAPFTLGQRITDVSPEQRQQLRKEAEDCGLTLLGLHWLLARTEGFHLTSADPSTRLRTASYLIELGRCCRDLGGDILVFGSPAQRNIPAGLSRGEAMDHGVDTLRQAMPTLSDLGVRLCLEPLSTNETNFLNTCAEGIELIELVNNPMCRLHVDVKAMSSEQSAIPELLRRHAPYITHFHANDPNKRGPGFGDVDFVPIFQALKDIRYAGWVSVEVFDYAPDPFTIAGRSIDYMKMCCEKVNTNLTDRAD
jgi:sugar phosphate isomerase/epimerase